MGGAFCQHCIGSLAVRVSSEARSPGLQEPVRLSRPVRDREGGRRKPEQAARMLLLVMAHNPACRIIANRRRYPIKRQAGRFEC